jgi:hypothetical protein
MRSVDPDPIKAMFAAAEARRKRRANPVKKEGRRAYTLKRTVRATEPVDSPVEPAIPVRWYDPSKDFPTLSAECPIWADELRRIMRKCIRRR